MKNSGSTEKVVFVGDTISDENGAKTVGIDFIAVTYGYGYKASKRERDSVVIGYANTPEEVKKMITGSI